MVGANDQGRLVRIADAHDRTWYTFAGLGGYAHGAGDRGILHRLGFQEPELAKRIGSLAGGQFKLGGIAKLLSAKSDLLLMDEPDNHLDLASKAMLESLIERFDGTFIAQQKRDSPH